MPALDPQNVRLQDRDVAMLLDLLESRVLSLDHVRALHFQNKNEMAKKRVQRLKSAKLLAERPRRIGEPSILHLTWNGYMALRDGGHVGDDLRHSPKAFTRRMKVSGITLAHELAIGDVRTSFIGAIRQSKRFELAKFDVWPRRYDFTVHDGHSRVNVKPDGYLQVMEKKNDEDFQHDFFLEVDTGSETLDRVVEKCVNYREYHRRGGYAVFCGGTREESKLYPFQVLVVCRSEERRDNLAERLLSVQPPFATMILITTQGQCVGDPLGDIWMTPAAYKNRAEESLRLCSLCE
jgi:Replication-relaxation